MQTGTEQAGQWEEIWERRGFFDAAIDAGRSVYNWFFRRTLREYLSPDSSLLELGSGRASLTISMAPRIKKLVGIDISPAAVAQANAAAKRLGLSNASFMLDDCTKLALEERFDFVWSQGLLEHFEDPVLIAREHYRMLAPGGVALLSVPYKYSYHTLWYKLTRPRFLRRFWPWTEQRFFDRKELLEVGKAVTPHARVFLLQPLPLGLVFLELRRPA
ncbi:MAG TPA: class I SAM-dependent methyltransferase [Candidatus Paceibacterota bacterium]|nr:class I SAM-dependent methyltransferase [Candidatus Paceibacterota bacterium]